MFLSYKRQPCVYEEDAAREITLISEGFSSIMDFQVRDLELNDLEKGLLDLLAQLTTVGELSRAKTEAAVKELFALPKIYKVVVIEDVGRKRIVATAKLVLERKLTRQCGTCGHIEDVVVDKECHGKKLGKRVVQTLLDHAQKAGCYKVILDCSDQNVAFYEKCGFEKKEVQMAKYLQDGDARIGTQH